MVQIVDTSVAIKWFVEESGRTQALSLLSELLSGPQEFAVPELFFFELAHVFNRLIPSPTKGQTDLLEQIPLVGIQRFSMSVELMGGIRHFQLKGLSGYDAAYVALAKLLKGTWVTFDEVAHRRIVGERLSRLLQKTY